MYKSQPTPTPGVKHKIGRSDVLLHIADMADELKKLARDADDPVLVALLGMVQQHAILQASQPLAPTRQNLAKPTLTS